MVFHGSLPDDALDMLFDRVRVAVAPLLSGAGQKGKVNQAWAKGTPVVATPIAVEGMHATHEVDVLVADSAWEFASAVARLHSDCVIWARLASGGWRAVKKHFSPEAAEQRLKLALNALDAGRMRTRPLYCKE